MGTGRKPVATTSVAETTRSKHTTSTRRGRHERPQDGVGRLRAAALQKLTDAEKRRHSGSKASCSPQAQPAPGFPDTRGGIRASGPQPRTAAHGPPAGLSPGAPPAFSRLRGLSSSRRLPSGLPCPGICSPDQGWGGVLPVRRNVPSAGGCPDGP